MPSYEITCYTPRHDIPYHTIPYHTIPYHTIPCHTMCSAYLCSLVESAAWASIVLSFLNKKKSEYLRAFTLLLEPLNTWPSSVKLNLAIGIGIQNFPEGLAVSLPLQAAGISTLKSFWYGQLSGMVEPLAGVLGAVGVTFAEPALPYALAFAAGAMIYVVIDDIVPEAHQSGNGKLASWAAVVGFLVMMSLDVGLG
ncbi:hypothetical protein K0M31_019446 [Melipona bicolor]|uniref:Zinc transporter ZIP11 n=1 Tax=Melipona bicolor TaxID=60889 RepID=A0AA40KRD8_9HYME|nr:hypothetical protein K0M31_019446 [Melipona bicolor]